MLLILLLWTVYIISSYKESRNICEWRDKIIDLICCRSIFGFFESLKNSFIFFICALLYSGSYINYFLSEWATWVKIVQHAVQSGPEILQSIFVGWDNSLRVSSHPSVWSCLLQYAQHISVRHCSFLLFLTFSPHSESGISLMTRHRACGQW